MVDNTALSKQAAARLGNRPPAAAADGWRTVGRAALSARDHQELQFTAKLRAAGWVLPAQVPADYLLRVYDTRLEPQYLRELVPELGAAAAGTAVIIGGTSFRSPSAKIGRRCVPLPCGGGGQMGMTPTPYWSRPDLTLLNGLGGPGSSWRWRQRALG